MRLVTGFLCLMLCISGIEKVTGQEYVQSLDIRIEHKPKIVTINGKPTVYYELHLANFSDASVKLTKLEVKDHVGNTPVFSVTGDEWGHRHKTAGTSEELPEGVLSPGDASVIYLEFTLPAELKGRKLQHQFYLVFPDKETKDTVSVAGPVMELRETEIVLGPPLRGGPWVAIYAPSWERGHRRVFYTVKGKARIPGRFAIDFMKLDDAGKVVKGNKDLIKNWYGYGAEVLAVADGIVTSARDDFSESPTISGHPRYSAAKATGNYLSIDIGNNCYVFYEHLKPGSIRVKAGQKVKKGEVIASLGFTGQSSGPHLHLHVANADSPLGAEGIPFLLEDFSLLGNYKDLSNFKKEPWIPVKDKDHPKITRERPGPNSVIRFFP